MSKTVLSLECHLVIDSGIFLGRTCLLGKALGISPSPKSTDPCWLCARDTEMTVPTMRRPSRHYKYNMEVSHGVPEGEASPLPRHLKARLEQARQKCLMSEQFLPDSPLLLCFSYGHNPRANTLCFSYGHNPRANTLWNNVSFLNIDVPLSTGLQFLSLSRILGSIVPLASNPQSMRKSLYI